MSDHKPHPRKWCLSKKQFSLYNKSKHVLTLQMIVNLSILEISVRAWDALCACTSGDLICNASEMHLCGRELVFRCSSLVSSPVCRVARSGQWRGIGLHTVKIRRPVTRKLICGVGWNEEGRTPAKKPDARFSFLLHPPLRLLSLVEVRPIDEHEQMATASGTKMREDRKSSLVFLQIFKCVSM